MLVQIAVCEETLDLKLDKSFLSNVSKHKQTSLDLKTKLRSLSGNEITLTATDESLCVRKNSQISSTRSYE